MPTLGEAVAPLYYEDNHQAVETQAFTGTFADVLGHIQTAAEATRPIDFWQPGRLVVGALEHKITSYGALQEAPRLITATSDLAIGIHGGELTLERLEAYAELISEEYDGLLGQRLKHEKDHVSAKSSDPRYSRTAAEALNGHTEGGSVLFIALGRGGITPGMFTYLHYAHLAQSGEHSFYPVRFARCSEQDAQPQVTEEEADHIRHMADDRQHIVVYDEDASTGRTQKQAVRFFSNLVGREVLPLANRGSDPAETLPLLGIQAFHRTKDLTHR